MSKPGSEFAELELDLFDVPVTPVPDPAPLPDPLSSSLFPSPFPSPLPSSSVPVPSVLPVFTAEENGSVAGL
ncbi:Uncharacterised protein [Mycobacteroides abscessus subsp. abscessus]|nr:Uncharacterised protein [Mycobacteroides abscessus subsp. abscessus]